MAMVDADWSIDEATGNIRYIGDDHAAASPSYATVIEFHRWLQDKADDATFVGDDEMDITISTPSDRSTDNIITLINGFNIDATAAEHLYDGSIIQAGGATIYDGIVNFGNTPNIQLIQNGAVLADDWWNEDPASAGFGLNSDSAAGISHRFMILVRDGGADIDGRKLIGTSRNFGNTYTEFQISATSRGNNVLALSESDDLNNNTASGTVATWTDVVNDNESYVGIDASGDGADEFYYSNWEFGSRSVNEFYERAKYLTREGSAETLYGLNGELFRGITHQIPYDTLSGVLDEGQNLAWGTEVAYDTELSSGLTVGEFYTFSISGAVGQLIALDDDGTTGFAIFAIESGTVVDNDIFTRVDGTANDGATVNITVNDASASGGVGRILADDGSATVWIQLLKGSPPVNDLKLWETSTAGVYDNGTSNNALTNGSVTERSISTPFVGQSTGSAIIGAYGLGIGADDLTASDTVFDLTNAAITPPNNVTFTVSGLISTEDRVLVGPETGGGLEVNQLTLQTSLTTDNITSVVTTAAIPTDTPSSGTIRVQDDNGLYRRLEYSSYTGSTFTISSTDGNEDFATTNATQPRNIFVSYIDKEATAAQESFTSVYSSDRPLFVRVRDGGSSPIKTFETTGTLGSAGGSATAIRTPDE